MTGFYYYITVSYCDIFYCAIIVHYCVSRALFCNLKVPYCVIIVKFCNNSVTFFVISVPYYATVSFSCHHSSLICHKCWMMSASYSCDMLFHITALFYHHNALVWYHLLSWQHSTLLLHHNHISCNKLPYCEIIVLNSAILMSCCSKLMSHCITKGSILPSKCLNFASKYFKLPTQYSIVSSH